MNRIIGKVFILILVTSLAACGVPLQETLDEYNQEIEANTGTVVEIVTAQDDALPATVQVAIEVVQPPSPFPAHGSAHLLYELQLTNYERRPLTLTSIEVTGIEGEAEEPLATYEGDAVTDLMAALGVSPAESATPLLPAGGSSVVFMGLEFPTMAEVPSSLKHVLTFAEEGEEEASTVSILPQMDILEMAPVAVSRLAYGDQPKVYLMCSTS